MALDRDRVLGAAGGPSGGGASSQTPGRPAPEEERIRLKREGGPGSPGKEILHTREDGQAETPENPIRLDEFLASRGRGEETTAGTNPGGSTGGSSQGSSSGESHVAKGKTGQGRESSFKVSRLYNLELVIYTVSGHKYTARLGFKDDVKTGRLDQEEAIRMLERVENDLRRKTFQRPITYTDAKGGDATVEYIFNPSNVECVSIVRKY